MLKNYPKLRQSDSVYDVTADYELQFPYYLDGYELDTEAKGYLTEARILAGGDVYTLTVYDPVRLSQDAEAEVPAHGYLAVANLLVVPRVTRDEITKAVRLLADSGFHELVPDSARS
jgi:hypothetical protein